MAVLAGPLLGDRDRSLEAAREEVQARRAYQDFLALWKDADADIPVLRGARAEYAKLSDR